MTAWSAVSPRTTTMTGPPTTTTWPTPTRTRGVSGRPAVPAAATAWSTPCRAGASSQKGTPMNRTMKQLAQEAIDIQNACNGIGVAQGFARSMLALHELLNKKPFIRLSEHPIWCLWVSKLHDMGHMGLSDTDRYIAAYSACMAMAAEDETITHFLSPAERL